jgi:hypothetical protein
MKPYVRIPKDHVFPPCEVCGLPTPTKNKYGDVLPASGRAKLKTCGSKDCHGEMLARANEARRLLMSKVKAPMPKPAVLTDPVAIAYRSFNLRGPQHASS